MNIFLLLILWVPGNGAGDSVDDLLVITSMGTPIDQISKGQLRQLYLKKIEELNKVKLTPVQLKEKHPLRKVFDQMVLGKRFDVQNYWVQQKFLASEKPPISVTNEAFVLIFVERNDGFIGYVHKSLQGEVKRLGLKILEVTQ